MLDLEVMAKTMYGEARGEFFKLHGGTAALIAIGNVIMNRVKEKRFGQTILEVCQRPWQFSCWNSSDPNRKIIDFVKRDNVVFDMCCKIADLLINNRCPDLTKGSNHYFSKMIKNPPFWSKKAKTNVIIGDHIFLYLGG